MPDDKPLLSICIPTCNRASRLDRALQSIVNQKVFQQTDLIEVVISDNCSTDHTEQILQTYQEQFPEKIRVLRTASAIEATYNFAHVLEGASGKLRKLHNDTLVVNDGALVDLLKVVKNYENKRPFLFFLNGNGIKRTTSEIIQCSDLDSFIRYVSFYCTWIGAFSIWENEIDIYIDYFKREYSHFAQTETLFRAIQDKKGILVYEPKFSISQPEYSNRDIKYLENIFFAEYINLLINENKRLHLSDNALNREIRRFCLIYYINWYYKLSGDKFNRLFFRDFHFIKKYASFMTFYSTHFSYLAFCMIRGVRNPFIRKILKLLKGFL